MTCHLLAQVSVETGIHNAFVEAQQAAGVEVRQSSVSAKWTSAMGSKHVFRVMCTPEQLVILSLKHEVSMVEFDDTHDTQWRKITSKWYNTIQE